MASLTHRVRPDEAGRIDLIVQKLTGRSRTQVRGLFDHDRVRLDGVVCADAGARVTAGSEVTVDYDPHRNYKERPRTYQSAIFELVFEDEWLLVVDKKAGYLTVPNDPRDQNTVVGGLSRYLSRNQKKRRSAATVHRLDRDTSGLLVFAKSEKIAQQIKSQFEKRKPLREYVAIVAGRLETPKGTFRSYLVTDEDLNQHSTTDQSKGKLAITHYQVEKIFDGATLVRVTLETGRRNQIRVHFAERGHPVLGDARYEAKRARHPRWKWRRLALHAAVLGFKHPVTGGVLSFRSKVPEEFEIFVGTGKRR